MPFEEVDYNPFAEPEVTGETPWGEVGMEAVANIPSSAKRLAGDIYQAVRHPIETGKSVVGLARGVAQKAIPGEQAQEKYADAMGEFIKERYGGEEELKRTIAEDPVGALADLAMVFTVAGGTLKTAGKVRGLEKAAKTGEVISKIGTAAEPLSLAAKAGVGALKGVPKFVPERIYETVAKIPPTKFKNPKDRIRAVRTALDEGIPPTQRGVDLLWEKVGVIEDKVANIIGKSPDEPIQTGDIARALNDVRKDWADDPFARQFLDEIDALEVEFLRGKGKTITAKNAQKMKKRAYKTIRKAYDKELTSVGEDARMAVADGTLKELKTLFPELGELGVEEGKLLDLNKAIFNAVGRIENHKMFSLTSMMGGLGVGGVTQSPMAALSTLALVQIIGHPKVQSQLAIALTRAKKAKLSEVARKGTGARVAAEQAGRLTGEEE
jgi:hypothetical protein